jgi:hypothetical protein
MIGARRSLLLSYRRFRRLFWVMSLAPLIGAGGCFAPALELAPLAIQGVGMAGAGALQAVGYKRTDSPDDATMDANEKEERCDDLQLEVPGTIEFRVVDESPAAWRELQLGGSADAPHWLAVADAQSDANGWRPVANLHNMSFAPPLEHGLRQGKPNYLAYAPAEPQSDIERDQLVALTSDFGAGMGTFQWNGRAYQYTLVNRLPCFPGPTAVAG